MPIRDPNGRDAYLCPPHKKSDYTVIGTFHGSPKWRNHKQQGSQNVWYYVNGNSKIKEWLTLPIASPSAEKFNESSRILYGARIAYWKHYQPCSCHHKFKKISNYLGVSHASPSFPTKNDIKSGCQIQKRALQKMAHS